MPFNYRALGVDPKLINFDNGTVSFANQFTLPAYNKKLLPPDDVPRNWNDLIDAKWKGGGGRGTLSEAVKRLEPS